MEILIRAAQNKQRSRMRPAGRQFDMPVVNDGYMYLQWPVIFIHF